MVRLSISILFLLTANVFGQNSFQAIIRDSLTLETLPGAIAVIPGTTMGATADADGKLVLNNIPDGKTILSISLIGYGSKTVEVVFPRKEEVTEILLSSQGIAIDEVTVSTTRMRSRIEDLPMRLEVIGAEDLDEESSVEPETIGSILGDIAGIQWQQTSAVSGNSNIRIQGLSGKYTQILRDGLPMFEGFNGGFGVLDIPPLDLKQAEIIKGSASTLYGGGAIGGLINLVSKEPVDSSELILSFNQTSLKESNASVFASGKNKKAGYTVYAGGTYQRAVDVDHDGFSDQPETDALQIHPRIFLYAERKELKIGVSGSANHYLGGDMHLIDKDADSTHVYFEENNTKRGSLDFDLSAGLGKENVFEVKGLVSLFDRNLEEPEFIFQAHQFSSYLEISYLIHHKKNNLITGVNFSSGVFTVDQVTYIDPVNPAAGSLKGFDRNTAGFFALDDWKITDVMTLETGLRIDYNNIYREFILPHISFLIKPGKDFTARAGGGLGYKIPDIYQADDQDIDLKNVLPLDNSVQPEKSAGANVDVNYNHLFGKISLTLNESVFYTRVNSPVSTVTNPDGTIAFGNFDDHIDSKGSETYVRIGLEHFDFYLGYVYAQPERYTDAGKFDVTLNARHKFAADAVYEIENSWKFGAEAAYTGEQYISEVEKRRGYPFVAAMIQKTLGKFQLTLNCENLLDFRQSSVENVVLPPYEHPSFAPVWAPLEGRIVNLAVRFKM
jgi:outer membrane receptor for ferrienterochelin and colicins